jgi:hypothetical protein
MSHGISVGQLNAFEVQRVLDGGQAVEERLMRRDERAARMDDMKEELDNQFDRLQAARTARRPDPDASATVAGPATPEPPKSADLSVSVGASQDGVSHGSPVPSRSPAPRMSRQPSNAVTRQTSNAIVGRQASTVVGRQFSNAVSVASSNGEDDEINSPDANARQARPSALTRLQSMDRGGTSRRKTRASGIGLGVPGGQPGGYEDEELQPLGPTATPIEVNIRRSMLGNLIEAVGMGTAKRAINATAESIHVASNTLFAAQSALWDSFTLNRKCFDFYVKVKTVLEGMISCTIAGTEEEDIKRVLQDMMALAAMQLGPQFSTEWNAECNLPGPLYVALNNSGVPKPTTAVGADKTKGIPDYFNVGSNDKELFDRMETVKNSVLRMNRFGDAAFANVVEYFNENLRDWSDAKICALGFEEALKKEGDRIRAIFNKELDVVKIDAVKLRREVAELLQDNAGLQKIIEEINADYSSMKDLPDEILALKTAIAKDKEKEAELHEEMRKLLIKQAKFDDQLAAKQGLVDEAKAHDGLLQYKVQVLEKSLEEETRTHTHTKATLSDTQLELSIVHRREQARWEAGVNESVQTDPLPTADGSTQTEFIMPSLRVKTIMRAEEGSRVKYPVTVTAVSPRCAEDKDARRMREVRPSTTNINLNENIGCLACLIGIDEES